jgi:hypothetical protein
LRSLGKMAARAAVTGRVAVQTLVSGGGESLQPAAYLATDVTI